MKLKPCRSCRSGRHCGGRKVDGTVRCKYIYCHYWRQRRGTHDTCMQWERRAAK